MLINQKTMTSPIVSGPTLFNRLKANTGLTKALQEELLSLCLMINVKIDAGFF